MHRSLALALALAACSTQDLSNQGSACLDDGVVTVAFGTCLSTPCDALRGASCTATVDGDVLVVTSTGTKVTSGLQCNDDCLFATVTCDAPADLEDVTALRYAGLDRGLDAECDGP